MQTRSILIDNRTHCRQSGAVSVCAAVCPPLHYQVVTLLSCLFAVFAYAVILFRRPYVLFGFQNHLYLYKDNVAVRTDNFVVYTDNVMSYTDRSVSCTDASDSMDPIEYEYKFNKGWNINSFWTEDVAGIYHHYEVSVSTIPGDAVWTTD